MCHCGLHHKPFHLASVSDVDGEIEHLKSQIRALSIRRNALLPIHRLPPETLLTIFQYVAEQHLEQNKNSEWTYITRVCVHWRDLALNDPRLWMKITNAPMPLVRQALSSSRHLPLSIDYGGQSRSAGRWTLRMAELALVSQHLSRIQSMEIVTSMNLTPLIHLWNKPKPALKNLKIQSSGLSGQPSFPLTLEGAPLLERLDLERISFLLPQLGSLGQLRKLRVQSVPIDSRMNLAQWTRALSGMPLLEDLTLIANVRFNALDALPENLSRVHLPHLRNLDVGDSIDVLRHLYRCLVVPSTTRINLWAYISDSLSLISSVADLASKVGGTIRQADGRPDLASLLVFCSCSHLDVSVFARDAPLFPQRRATPDVPAAVRIVLELTQDTFAEALASAALEGFKPLLTAMPAIRAATVEIDSASYLRADPPAPRTGLLSLLGAALALESLTFRHTATDDDLLLLRDLGDSLLWRDKHLMPRLRTLAFDSVMLTRARIANVIHALEHRQIQLMQLTRCPGTRSSDVQELRAHVDCVKWDAELA